jgi:hypothetical protein
MLVGVLPVRVFVCSLVHEYVTLGSTGLYGVAIPLGMAPVPGEFNCIGHHNELSLLLLTNFFAISKKLSGFKLL